MARYLLKRILQGFFSVVVVAAIVMIMVYSLMNRDLIFAKDPAISHQNNNAKITYKYQKWEEYGYLDYVTYADYVNQLIARGELDPQSKDEILRIGRTTVEDSPAVKEYVASFSEEYEARGYHIQRLDAVLMGGKRVADGGQQQLFAYKDIPLIRRLWNYFSNLIQIDTVYAIQEDVGERGLTFTWYDPAYGGKRFSPAILGNGTYHKYLLYFDAKFPFVHQNFITLNLGKSYSVNKGIDVFETVTASQGSYVKDTVIYPTGLTEESADDLHSATYVAGSRASNPIYQTRFTDDYTNVKTVKRGLSQMGYSFVIGILAVIMAYAIGIPAGLLMARRKDRFVDQLGTIYIVFIIAVPSLAYIFLFKAIGGGLGLPTTFDMESDSRLIYVLPVISLALPAIANLMKWMRRYMIDQMHSDYVKFARAGGLTEGEIFTKHVLKNASIPIIHGIPAGVLGALTGAIITERVYVVPGAGNLLTMAINQYDNGVIVGVTLFYAVLSVVSIIIGDILMAAADPRISFTTKDR